MTLRSTGVPAARWWLAGLLLLCAWQAWPVLRPVHVEGFSASIQSLAMHLSAGDIRRYDLIYPINLQFFATSRFGMVLAAAAGYWIAPNSGEWPMRLVMWVAFAGMFGSALVLVRRWAATSTPWALAALLLMPGVFETAFFYNDNLLSSALLMPALVMLTAPTRLSSARALLSGCLFGLAIVARADALILGVAVVLCLLGFGAEAGTGKVRFRASVRAAVPFGVGVLLPVLLLPALLHFSLLDTFRLASHVVGLWDRGSSLAQHRQSLQRAVGLPGALAAAIGLMALLTRRSWRTAILLVGVPLVYNLVYLGKMWQPRQLLPLMPFFGALIAIGARAIGEMRWRWSRHVAIAFVALVWLLPPRHATVQDGPHALLGRFWMPLIWSAWQGGVRADFDRLGTLVQGLPADAVVVTDYWDADRYLHLTLQEAGYRVLPSATCQSNVETFERDGAIVRHLRLHLPFLGDWERRLPRELLRDAARCPPLPHSTVYYLATADRLDKVPPGFDQSLVQTDNRWLRRIGHTPLAFIRLAGWPDPAFAAALARQADGAGERPGVASPALPGATDEATAQALRPLLQGYWNPGASAR